MTADDFRKQLEEAGLDTSGWVGGSGGVRQPEFLRRQVALLKTLETVLQSQIQQDRSTITELYLRRIKAKHGGGE